MEVRILGAGAYGGALGEVLEKNGHMVVFYDPYKFPERGLEESLRGGEVILLAVPSETVREVLGQIPEKYTFRPLIVATKGVMALPVYTKKFFYVEILSGPGFASEIRSGKKVRLTVASEGAPGVGAVGREFSARAKVPTSACRKKTVTEELFEGSQITFDKTSDRAGVLMLGGLKNIYAIGAGERGLKIRTGEFKEYISAAIREAEKFLIFNGGFLETARLSAGLGDFVLTCGSEESRNYMFGKNGYKKRGKETVEGLNAVREITERGMRIPGGTKILREIIRKVRNESKR